VGRPSACLVSDGTSCTLRVNTWNNLYFTCAEAESHVFPGVSELQKASTEHSSIHKYNRNNVYLIRSFKTHVS